LTDDYANYLSGHAAAA